MILAKKSYYFVDEKTGETCFRCVFCGDKCKAKHETEREYLPGLCWHPELRKLDSQGRMCSNCYNWDYDLFKRHDSPRKRDPLKHKSGRQLGLKGWLDEENESMERWFQ